MLLSIGKRDTRPDDIVPLLLACHERIRGFLELARRAATTDEATDAEVSEACRGVARYFLEAFPLHVLDEEDSVLPRLRGRDPAIERSLEAMRLEHAAHEPAVRALLDALAALGAAPADRALRASLARVLGALEPDIARHLAEEEATIFPALAALPDAERAQIVAELRARRARLND